MSLKKRASWKNRVADKVMDAEWRKDVADQATHVVKDAALTVGTTVSDTASTLAGKAGESMAEVKDEMAGTLENLKPQRTGRGKRRARRLLAAVGVGAVAQYFLDSRNGAARRERLRNRTNTAAAAAASGFDKAASAAHSAADLTGEEDLPGQRRAAPEDTLQPS